MKKFFYISAVLLLGACADLSVSKEEALKGELPRDFDWKVYGEINNDVLQSQIIFDIDAKLSTAYASSANASLARKDDCAKFLLDESGEASDFAEDLYLNYVGCPKKGWNENEACEGKYSQVYSYNHDRNGNPRCIIGGCWSGGWDESIDNKESLKDTLPSIVDRYISQASNNDVRIRTICKFILPNAKTKEEAESYLKSFTYDSTLVTRHFFLVGRSEGRPYKHCDDASMNYHPDRLREPSLALILGEGDASSGNMIHDYSAHLFCFDKITQGIYLLK